MTSFIDIYSRAMTLLKSPVLSRLQDNDLYSFCMVMNQYLDTARTFYNPNPETQGRVSKFTAPQDGYNDFNADGLTNEFTLSGSVIPTSDSIFKVVVDGEDVHEYSFDEETRNLTIELTPNTGAYVEIYWLNDGNFSSLTDEDITLLSMAMCWAWAIQTQNNQLDIDRQPNDSDFKLHAEGTTINAKIDWVKHYEEMFKRELSKADWRPFFRKVR